MSTEQAGRHPGLASSAELPVPHCGHRGTGEEPHHCCLALSVPSDHCWHIFSVLEKAKLKSFTMRLTF